jgi:hypothetical protein
MIACYHCGKGIRGKAVHHVPSNLHIQLGLDSARSYHERCYQISEHNAARELGFACAEHVLRDAGCPRCPQS